MTLIDPAIHVAIQDLDEITQLHLSPLGTDALAGRAAQVYLTGANPQPIAFTLIEPPYGIAEVVPNSAGKRLRHQALAVGGEALALGIGVASELDIVFHHDIDGTLLPERTWPRLAASAVEGEDDRDLGHVLDVDGCFFVATVEEDDTERASGAMCRQQSTPDRKGQGQRYPEHHRLPLHG